MSGNGQTTKFVNSAGTGGLDLVDERISSDRIYILKTECGCIFNWLWKSELVNSTFTNKQRLASTNHSSVKKNAFVIVPLMFIKPHEMFRCWSRLINIRQLGVLGVVILSWDVFNTDVDATSALLSTMFHKNRMPWVNEDLPMDVEDVPEVFGICPSLFGRQRDQLWRAISYWLLQG